MAVIACAKCGDEAPADVLHVPKGMVWLCDPCDREMSLALNG